jgi:hypothetical protein
MIYIIIYFILAIIWSFYCAYKTSKMGHLGKLFYNQFMTFLTNLIVFPYAVYYAIKHKKL